MTRALNERPIMARPLNQPGRWTKRGHKIRQLMPLYIFLLPAIGITLVFAYLPMFSNYIAFLDYDFVKGWFGFASPFMGLKNFAFLKEAWFYQLAGRTILYSLAVIVFSFPAPLILALLINELRHALYKKCVQTVSYIPHFVSWVTVGGLFYLFMSTDPSGLINNIKTALFGGPRISFMQDSKLFLPFIVISQVWKELGWGTIIYLAAITVVDPQLYEAAEVDGASRWKRMWHVTLPGLLPTTCILLILTLNGLFSSNFDQILNLQNDVIRNETYTINVFTYFRGVRNAQYAFAAAVGLFQGLVSLVLVLIVNNTTKRLGDTGII